MTSRHRSLALALLVAGLIAGCGDTKPDTPAEETAKPLRVQHALGETFVPGRADRPVTLQPGELEDALALGVRPVGAATPGARGGFPRYLRDRVDGVEPVGPVGHPDVARIRALDPDIILASIPTDRGIYEQLSNIAGTVMADEGVDWKPNLRQDGEALGRVDDAEALLSAYDRRADRLRRKLERRRVGGGPALTRALPAQVRPFLRRRFVASILDDLDVPHAPPNDADRSGARAGRFDHWSLGGGVLAANRVLDDLERYLGR